ncbi:hypothetical protein T10_11430 [Trichinella papuae]|uniref:Uncharacterized protein n=1 Tax=Trichinella papuae TaxID=268474 RepID=A0A0V1M8V7_9BILA|nr:hypothetical protein T10_11430 [Trichinella papuae]
MTSVKCEKLDKEKQNSYSKNDREKDATLVSSIVCPKLTVCLVCGTPLPKQGMSVVIFLQCDC